MNIPTIDQFARRRVARKRHGAPPGPLTLVAATYTNAFPYLRLTFDRPVSIAAIDVLAIVVDYQFSAVKLRGSGTATLITATQVNVPMTAFTNSSGTQVLLTATAANGIVAGGDGGPWAGVTNVGLPFAG